MFGAEENTVRFLLPAGCRAHKRGHLKSPRHDFKVWQAGTFESGGAFYQTNTSLSTQHITPTCATGGAAAALILMEFSGAATSSPLVSSSSAYCTYCGTTMTSGTISGTSGQLVVLSASNYYTPTWEIGR